MTVSNFSQFHVHFCVNALSIQTNHSLAYDIATLTTCVMNAVLSPAAVAGNLLVLAAIWKDPSLRTPTYILIGGLAFTDFGTGLIAQPFYAVERYAEFKRNKIKYCFAYRIANMAGPYFGVISVFTITTMAVERWLHVSHSSLITVRRTIILYCLFLIVPFPYAAMRWFILQEPSVLPSSMLLTGFFGLTCLFVMVFAYCKVFRIIRHHQRQILNHGNQSINLKKYKRSVFTILYILACFLVCYTPHLISNVVVGISADFTETSSAFVHFTATMFYWSCLLNPILYCWRLKAIREGATGILKSISVGIGATCQFG